MRRDPHTFIAGEDRDFCLRCANCRGEEHYTLPLSLRRVVAITKSFEADHRSCKQRPE